MLREIPLETGHVRAITNYMLDSKPPQVIHGDRPTYN